MRARVLLTIQYLGTRYAGWQRQENALGVQQVLEEAFERLFGQPFILESAGRTDSGVHSLGQRAHVDLPVVMPPRGLVLGINNLLPTDIRLAEVLPVAADFHARFQAKSKTYLYQIWNGSVVNVFFRETHAHVPGQLDERLMQEGADFLVGKHDFRCYTVLEPEVRSTWRTIYRIEVIRKRERIQIRVTGDGFLRYMVRRITGTLIEIGKGKLDPAAAGHALEPQHHEARWTAPASGLTLENVSYEQPQTAVEVADC